MGASRPGPERRGRSLASVTDPSTPVSEPVSNPAADAVSQPVTDAVTDPVSRPGQQPHTHVHSDAAMTAEPGRPRIVLTFGTYDVFHVGHLRLLERAAALGDRLVVGVSADALNVAKKGRRPVFSQDERMEIVAALKCVQEVFVEESLEQKRDYLVEHHADVLAMGDDWEGRFDEFGDLVEVVYFPRTPSVSTTEVIEHIAGR